MASQVFYRKFRPQTLAELAGQPHVTQTLLNALKNGNVSHAYLFCGPRGTGKTSTARILAKAVNCLTNNGKGEPCNTCEMCRAIMEDRAMDVIEIDAASNRGIDNIRDLREKVNYVPTRARRKVYIIDEFHMLSKEASNALLKTLEEPPPHVVFILATTESHKVLPTILSRCQHFDFRRLSRADVVAQLNKISQAENINIDSRSLQLVARSTTGSLRDAENLLEQLVAYYGHDISYSQVQDMLGITGDWRAREVLKHLINRDISAGMATLNSVNNDGIDLRQFNRELVENLRGLLLIKSGAAEAIDLNAEDIAELKDLAEMASLPQILTALKAFGQIDLSNNESSTLPLELALVDCYLDQESREVNKEKIAPVETKPASARSQVSPKPDLKKSEDKPVSSPGVPPQPVKEETTPPPAASSEPDLPETTGPADAPMLRESPGTAQPLSSEIERLRFNWKQILENVPANLKRTKAVALLRSAGCKPVSVESDTVVLSLKYSIHKENMEKPEYQQIVKKIISDYLGRPCNVRCICETEGNHLVRAAIKMGAQIINVEEK